MMMGMGDYLPPEPTARDYFEVTVSALDRSLNELADAADYLNAIEDETAAEFMREVDVIADRLYDIARKCKERSGVRA